MANSYTTNLNLVLPQVGGDTDNWGTDLNSDITAIDAIFAPAGTPVSINTTGKTFNGTANNFYLKDGTDATKIAQFSISGNTTGTTRTYTLPDTSDTLVTLTATQTLANKTLSSLALTGNVLLSGSAGTSGQVLTTAGAGSVPTWSTPAAGATGGGTDQIFWVNGQTVNTSFSIAANSNAGSFGPITVGASATVTVPSSSVWTVV